VSRAPWTYELPAAGGETGGLEDYVVYAVDGEPVGKVTVVLEADDDLYVVVDRGEPPLTHDRRAVPWETVEAVDHSALAVKLAQPAAELDGALELDPAKAVEPGVGEQRPDAEAVRVTRLPEPLMPVTVPAGEAGPTDRPFLYGGALGLGLLAVFFVLAGVALVTAGAGAWSLIAFVGASILGSAALATASRLWRRPYEGPPERRG
jgi:ribosomal protein L14E/L6E/L27E